MALSSQQILSLIENADFVRKLAVNGFAIAGLIIGEAASTIGRDERHNYAIQLINQDPLDHKNRFWRAYAATVLSIDTSLSESSDDAALQTAITNSWNDLAGVKN
ncbi:hypothetical protein Pse7367_3680 (plasmid) [Thalassoporum mexicanum PCC 7367]|uniref:hypothetical protein n=1 Tax=Thalassoporum mexicanum TaxID=3457544 RepID=UPI00029FE4AC|nr:hypothetical protein [Pseudanabaena sp. PCC 7367]AFY71913.1 hypothetical protein Pse7367_3680 [Pseudanabaena sp. PCC 7367]